MNPSFLRGESGRARLLAADLNRQDARPVMWDWVDRLGQGLLEASFSALFLVALVSSAMILYRQPLRRLRLARAGVLGLLALLPVELIGLVPRVDVSKMAQAAGLSSRAARHTLREWANSGEVRISATRGPRHAPPRAVLVGRTVVLLYLAGVGGGFTWLTVGYLGIALLAGRARLPGPRTRSIYESLAETHPGPLPRLRVAPRLRRPALVGLFRQTILLPAELDQEAPPRPTEGALRLTLLHELEHAKGRDSWFGLAGHVAQTLWFFLPPLWWVVRQMRLDQEFLADYLAAARFGPHGDYASSLLEFASGQPASALLGTPASLAGRLESRMPSTVDPSPLTQRVLMLVRRPFPLELRPPLWWSLALPCLVTLLTLGSASLRLDARALGAASGKFSARHISQTPGAHAFRVVRLELPAKIAGPRGRVPAFELPIRLPDRFVLSLEVLAAGGDFAYLRIAGISLDVAAGTMPDGPPTWHRVRIKRDGRVFVSVDDRPEQPLAAPADITPWLSLEPAPDRAGVYRHLVLSW